MTKAIEPENVGDRLVLVETTVAYLVARQSEIERLMEATEHLAAATLSVEDALRMVGEVKTRQEQIAQTVVNVSRLRRHRYRFVVLGACVLALAGVVAYGWHDRNQLHRDVRHLQTCQEHPHAALCLPHTTLGGK